jgi:AraC-like DNA-binding protein
MPAILLPQKVKIPAQYEHYTYPFATPTFRTSTSFSRIEQVTAIPGCRVSSIVNIAEKETEIRQHRKGVSIILQVVLQGKIACYVSSTERIILDKGTYNLLSTGYCRQVLAPGVCEFMRFEISPPLLKELLPAFSFMHDHLSGTSDKKLMRLVNQIRENSVNNDIQQLKLYTQITELIITAVTNLLPTDKNMNMSNPHQELISNIQTYINENLHTPISLSRLAGIYFISESKLKQDFKKYLNCSVQTYLQEQRMQKALLMLQQSDDDISAIATGVGYTNVSSFNREFRKHYACSPKEVRIR